MINDRCAVKARDGLGRATLSSMTCLVGYRIPGVGAAIACESRLSAGTVIASDECKKWLVCGSVVLAVSGTDGGLLPALSKARCRTWAQVEEAAEEYSRPRGLSWEMIAYDQRLDLMVVCDSSGCVQATDCYASGSGGSYAWGWFESRPRPETLPDVARTLRASVRAAIRRDSGCGGRVWSVRAPSRRSR